MESTIIQLKTLIYRCSLAEYSERLCSENADTGQVWDIIPLSQSPNEMKTPPLLFHYGFSQPKTHLVRKGKFPVFWKLNHNPAVSILAVPTPDRSRAHFYWSVSISLSVDL